MAEKVSQQYGYWYYVSLHTFTGHPVAYQEWLQGSVPYQHEGE